MGRRHTREDMLGAALEVTGRVGFASLTFGRVAKALGTSDRMVVYYFPTKAELINAVAARMGLALQSLLNQAFGVEPQSAHDLMRRAWPILASPDADPVFAAYLEIIGLAAAGQEPYRTLAPSLIEAWLEWLAPRIAVDPDQQQTAALGVIAQLDGLLLIRHVSGAAAAQRAATYFGLT